MSVTEKEVRHVAKLARIAMSDVMFKKDADIAEVRGIAMKLAQVSGKLLTGRRAAAAVMLAGGLFYTLGTFFYHRESIRYSHAIWHLFVIGGSVCHFVAVTQQVLSPRLA